MDHTFLLGSVAGICTTLAFIPQVVMTHRTHHTRDLSLGMLVLLAFGIMLWTVYGLILREAPIIAANGVTLVMVLYLLSMKIRYG